MDSAAKRLERAPARGALHWTWSGVVALYVGLTLAYGWPLLGAMGSALPSDTGDPGLITWFAWWNAHAVPLTARWWNAPMFFPLHGAFALSETALGLAPVTSVLQWLGASPVVAYNVAYLLSFPTAALAAHALVRRLTGRHDAALIAGLAFGFSPYRASQMPHLHLLMSCWMPLGLLALHRFIANHRPRDLVLLALCWLLNGLTTGYYLIFFAVLVGLWMIWFARTQRDWAAITVTLALASAPFAPLFAGYHRYQAGLGLSRSAAEIEVFSADLSAVWAASPHAWLPHHWTIEPRPEGELYPGVTILVLIVVGAVVTWRAAPSHRLSRLQAGLLIAAGLAALSAIVSWVIGPWHIKLSRTVVSVNHPYKAAFMSAWLVGAALLCDRRVVAGWRHASPFLFYAIGAALMLLFALGPTGRVFGALFLSPAPYAALMALPGGHTLRVPARFAMLFMLCLSAAAAFAFARLTRRGATAPLVAGLAIAIALEGWVPKLNLAAVPPMISLGGLDTNAAVLELPSQDLYRDTAAMLRATAHGHPVVNGFSGYGPPHYAVLQEGLRTFDASVLTALQQFGPLIVVVDRAYDDNGHYADFMEHVPDAEWVLRTGIGPAYVLPAAPPAAPVVGGPLSVASVAASGNDGIAHFMIDGVLATQWQTVGPQTAGDQVVITFDRPVTISRLEMDLGAFQVNYPRRLRISVADHHEPPVVVWEGGTAGAAMLAALADPVRTPLAIDLPRLAHGRQLFLTLAATDPVVYWSIAELRVFGR